MNEHVRIVRQNHQRNQGVDGDVRHGDQVEMNDLSDELLTCVWKMIVERRRTTFGDL